jgi:hypothetical protein
MRDHDTDGPTMDLKPVIHLLEACVERDSGVPGVDMGADSVLEDANMDRNRFNGPDKASMLCPNTCDSTIDVALVSSKTRAVPTRTVSSS